MSHRGASTTYTTSYNISIGGREGEKLCDAMRRMNDLDPTTAEGAGVTSTASQRGNTHTHTQTQQGFDLANKCDTGMHDRR